MLDRPLPASGRPAGEPVAPFSICLRAAIQSPGAGQPSKVELEKARWSNEPHDPGMPVNRLIVCRTKGFLGSSICAWPNNVPSSCAGGVCGPIRSISATSTPKANRSA